MAFCGLAAGAANGLLGAGGGMLLVPLLTKTRSLKEDEIFPASVSIILPICIISLLLSPNAEQLTWMDLLPYLGGSAAGGVLCGLFGKRIPTLWLHRILGALIIWGGLRNIC